MMPYKISDKEQGNIIIDFLRTNNWLNLEDEANAISVVDSYLKIYGKAQQRQKIIELMQEDEGAGLYEPPDGEQLNDKEK